ncbi:hypothetical protein C9374_006431 [Naegleria lovaniensis]|uniref:EF-hand domain-containing protein n=1 Tax=Naegleria lovaniensis TaxID=51637 RepID=A0AA88GNE8_NAELO|nr:uncharacterized protein C9374_006431 [Naegleria lovaniensis]KAG2381442.1 hypothetical protein C9374_006431 [Naegleria lovaniensis]
MPVNPSMLKKENYHRETYRNIFDMFDGDMDGILDEKDLLQVFSKLGKTETTKKDISDLINDLNASSKNEQISGITFDQFVELVGENDEEEKGRKILSFLTSKRSKKVAGIHTEQDMREAFNLIDDDRDGEITKQEFKNIVSKLQNLGSNASVNSPSTSMTISDAEIDYLFGMVEAKGGLNFDQFVTLFTKTMI